MFGLVELCYNRYVGNSKYVGPEDPAHNYEIVSALYGYPHSLYARSDGLLSEGVEGQPRRTTPNMT